MKTKAVEPQEVVVIDSEIKPIISAFKGRDIKTAKEMTQAVAFLSELNKIKDRIVKDKEKITKPLNETLKEVRGRYKPAETQLEDLIGELRAKISSYQTEKVRLEAEAEAKIVNDGRGLTMETMERKFGEIERVDDQVITDAGMVKFRTDKKLKVTDASLIPDKYWELDEANVLSDLKDGIKIPGAEIVEIQTPVNHR